MLTMSPTEQLDWIAQARGLLEQLLRCLTEAVNQWDLFDHGGPYFADITVQHPAYLSLLAIDSTFNKLRTLRQIVEGLKRCCEGFAGNVSPPTRAYVHFKVVYRSFQVAYATK